MTKWILIAALLPAAACSQAQALAQSDMVTIPGSYIGPDRTAKLCFIAAQFPDTHCPPPTDPHWHEKVAADSRVTVVSLCHAVSGMVSRVPDKPVYSIYIWGANSWDSLPERIFCGPDRVYALVPDADVKNRPTNASNIAPDRCKRIQKALQKHQLYNGDIDGDCRAQTEKAIGAFQKQNGEAVTGELTEDQERRLLASPGPDISADQALGQIAQSVREIKAAAQDLINNCISFCGQPRAIFESANEIERNLPSLREAVQKAPAPTAPPPPPAPAPAPAAVAECQRIDPAPDSREAETIVVVKGRAMKFRRVPAPKDGDVMVGLSRDFAQKLHVRAGELYVDPSRARPVALNRSVPETLRRVSDFKLQTGLIDAILFNQLRKGDPNASAVDARQVSYNQAVEFIQTLNKTCAGVASFRLPKEEELTYLLLQIYYPRNMDGRIRNEELKTCTDLHSSEPSFPGFTDLVGAYWQLTESRCEKFHFASPSPSCDGGFVIKGGTDQSPADECLPQFRGEVQPNIFNPKTSFRLVLLDK